MPKWQRYATFFVLAGLGLMCLSLAHLAGPGGDYPALAVSLLLLVLVVVAGRETAKWMQRYDARHGLGPGGSGTSPGGGPAGWKVSIGAGAGSALGLGLWQAVGPNSLALVLASLVLAYVGGIVIGPEPEPVAEEESAGSPHAD